LTQDEEIKTADIICTISTSTTDLFPPILPITTPLTMPPKRPSKRRGDEEDSRPSKKGGKKSKEPKSDTYDECLDGESSPLSLAVC
jgi:hypothetical protein